MDDYLEKVIEQLISELCDEYERQEATHLLWEALWLSGNYALITTLFFAQTETHILSVPNAGFTDNCRLHNMVIDWCKRHSIRLFNAPKLIEQLERSCIWKSPSFQRS